MKSERVYFGTEHQKAFIILEVRKAQGNSNHDPTTDTMNAIITKGMDEGIWNQEPGFATVKNFARNFMKQAKNVADVEKAKNAANAD